MLQYANTDLVPVTFRVNRTELRPTPQLDSICRTIHDVLGDDRVSLAYIWVGGSASPEGPIPNNRRLGEQRARRLADYLKAHAGVSAELMRVDNLWEDWYSVSRALLRKPVPAALSPYRDDADGSQVTREVLAIIDDEPDWARRKRRIQSISHGRVWRWMVDNVFPPFRNARLVIVCHAEATPVELPHMNPVAPELPGPGTVELPGVKLPPHPVRFLAIKGNLLGYAALEANLGFEVELWPRTSLDVPVWYSPYDFFSHTRKCRLLGIQPEFRYWLQGEAGEGAFLGAHFHVLGFNVELNDRARYQDPNHALVGGGLGFGYATHLDKGRRWLLEFNVGIGYAHYHYNTYAPEYNGPLRQSYRTGDWWGPTRIGVTIGYKWYKARHYRKAAYRRLTQKGGRL